MVVVEPAMQPRQLGAGLYPQLGVEVGERLVEEEHLRLPHDRAAERHPLALAARQLRGLPLEHALEAEDSAAASTRSAICSAGIFRIRSPNARLSRTLMCG